jgi:dual-specificity kinase
MQHVDHSAGDLIDLLQGLLRYDPTERFKAREALNHPFFTRSREQSIPPFNPNPHPFLYNQKN